MKEYLKKWCLEHKEEKKEYDRRRYLKYREKILERQKQYYNKHKEEKKEYNKQYQQIPIIRAKNLLKNYIIEDIKYERGESDLTPEWIIDNIFSQPCHYCGETDWVKIGCDRIDNSKPHTMDNVVPCCFKCNCKKHTKSYEEFKNKNMLDLFMFQ